MRRPRLSPADFALWYVLFFGCSRILRQSVRECLGGKMFFRGGIDERDNAGAGSKLRDPHFARPKRRCDEAQAPRMPPRHSHLTRTAW